MSSTSSTNNEVDDCIERHADDAKKAMDVQTIFANNPMFEKAYTKWAWPIIKDVLQECAKLNDGRPNP